MLARRVGVPSRSSLNVKELTDRTKAIYDQINAMRYVAASKALAKLETDLVAEAASAEADEAQLDREKELLGRLKPMLDKCVDGAIAELQQLDRNGDFYTVGKRIKELAPKFKGITRYDEQIEPLSQSLKRHPKSTEVRLGAQYFYLMDLMKKKRSDKLLLALQQFSLRYPKSAYGKAAGAAFKDLQNPKVKVEPRKYLTGGDGAGVSGC